MKSIRIAIAAVASLLVIAPPAQTQRYWKDTLYPFVYYTQIDKFWFGGYYAKYSPIGYIDQPERYNASFSFTAAASTVGSYRVLLLADMPAWWDGWRVTAAAFAVRFNRLGYFGLGNGTSWVKDSVSAANPYFYAVSRQTQQIRTTVQRRVVGHLRVLAGTVFEHTDYRTLPGDNIFRRELADSNLTDAQIGYLDFVGRVGVVFDSRDNELDPHRGVFLEALYGGGEEYSRLTAHARAFVQPIEPLTIAGHVGIESMPGDPPLAPMTEMESSQGPFVAVGGYYSLRGYYDGRFAGPGKLLGGIEARYALLWAPSILELKVVAFYDAARVFGPGETVRLTTQGLHHGAGGELALRFGRNTLITGGVGFGTEGSQFLFGTTWSF